MEYVILNNGAKMPTEVYGTYRISPENTIRHVEMALELGYRSIDTAQCYGNEKQVGKACRNSGLPCKKFSSSPNYGTAGITKTL